MGIEQQIRELNGIHSADRLYFAVSTVGLGFYGQPIIGDPVGQFDTAHEVTESLRLIPDPDDYWITPVAELTMMNCETKITVAQFIADGKIHVRGREWLSLNGPKEKKEHDHQTQADGGDTRSAPQETAARAQAQGR